MAALSDTCHVFIGSFIIIVVVMVQGVINFSFA